MNIKKIFVLLSLVALTTVQIYGENLKIVDVLTSNVLIGISTDTKDCHIDSKITPTIIVKVVNDDSYQHDVILEVKSDDGSSWRSSLVPIPPRQKEIISAELEFKEFGIHNIHISILDKDGNVLTSKKTAIAVANPIDIVNISCEDSFINESEPDVEICHSPWFTVTLKNNEYSQSDYNVEVWIAVVSQNFNKDASKYPDDKGVLYYGKKDSKVIYLAKGSERDVKFKIPPITGEEDTVKIQVHINVSGIHDYSDGPAYTNISITDDYKVKYMREVHPKKFSYPASLQDFQIVTTLNKDVVYILKDYYRTYKIEDVELKRLMKSHNYVDYEVLPRIYLKDDPYLVIAKLTLTNRFKDKSSVTVTIESDVDKTTKEIELEEFESKEIYLPVLVKYPENILNVSVQSGVYQYKITKNLNVKPIPVSPVYIESIEIDRGDGVYRPLENNYVDLLSNKGCTLKITLKNCYNKALSGNLTVDITDFKKDVVECPSRLSFRVGPRERTTLYLPISFKTAVKGDVKFTVKADGALTTYSKILYFDVNNIYVDIEYMGPYRAKVTLVNNEPQYSNLPIPGYENRFKVTFRNFMDKDVEAYTWIVARGENDRFMRISDKKFIYIPSKGESSSDFKIKFNEGFKGYLQVYISPVNYSNLTLVITKYATVYSPLSIEKLKWNNSGVYGEIKYSYPYPKPIYYRYWYVLEKDDKEIFKSVKYSKFIYPGEINRIKFKPQDLEDSNCTLRFFVEIPDFAKVNDTHYPIILERSVKMDINETESLHLTDETPVNKTEDIIAKVSNNITVNKTERKTENTTDSKEYSNSTLNRHIEENNLTDVFNKTKWKENIISSIKETETSNDMVKMVINFVVDIIESIFSTFGY